MEEKLGGVLRSQKQMDDFREVIHQCRFKDLGFVGPEFTWCNMQEGDSRVLLRLDRALATPEWINHYKNVKVHHLVESTSDHCALLLTDAAFRSCPLNVDSNSKLCGLKGLNAKTSFKELGMAAKI